MFTKSIIYACSVIMILSWSYDALDVFTSGTEGLSLSKKLGPLFMRAIPLIPALLGLFYKKYYPSMFKNGLFIVLAFIQILLATSLYWARDPMQPGILFIMIDIPLTVVLILLLLSDRNKFGTSE